MLKIQNYCVLFIEKSYICIMILVIMTLIDHLSLETRDCLSTKRLEQEINIVGLNK